jgi:hypothetical protein
VWRTRLFLVVLISSRASGAAALGQMTAAGVQMTPAVHGFADVGVHWSVVRAAEGAASRLAQDTCKQVLDDFTDANGRSLTTVLAMAGRTAVEAFALLRFVDGAAAPQCRPSTVLAWTEVGSRVVRVCGRRFRERYLHDSAAGAVILLHEFLHTLGLGENPPTSREITDRAALRCGRVQRPSARIGEPRAISMATAPR